jgi:hypothetical protein
MCELPENGNLQDWAIAYRRLGLSLVPCVPRSKKPSVPWTPFQQTPPTVDEVRQWWQGDAAYGIGILMGDASGGVVARDFDDMLAYDRWAKEHPDLADTLPTSVANRGRSVWVRSDFCEILALPDGELRGNGITVAPPSIHPKGDAYYWHVPLRPEIPVVDVADAGLDRAWDTDSTDDSRVHREPMSSVSSVWSVSSV